VVAGTCECGNEPSGSIKSGEYNNNNNNIITKITDNSQEMPFPFCVSRKKVLMMD
jgi:hypothetical protein